MSGQAIVLAHRNRRSPVVPEVGFILNGRECYADARDCLDIPFERCSPVREFTSYPFKRNYSGRFWSLTMRDHVPFESLFERTALLTLDRDPAVTAISSQPMWLIWPKAVGGIKHAPDFFVRRADGDGELIDVRPREQIDSRATYVFAATRDLCQQIGIHYRVICDLDRMLDRNLSAIARYRVNLWALPDALWPLLEKIQEEATIHEIAELLQQAEGPPALGWVYWLLWHGILDADLDQPLSLRTRVATARRRSIR